MWQIVYTVMYNTHQKYVEGFKMNTTPHTHLNEQGIAVKCYHECKSVLTDWKFMIGVTVSFPIEHALWELSPLRHITHWLGM